MGSLRFKASNYYYVQEEGSKHRYAHFLRNSHKISPQASNDAARVLLTQVSREEPSLCSVSSAPGATAALTLWSQGLLETDAWTRALNASAWFPACWAPAAPTATHWHPNIRSPLESRLVAAPLTWGGTSGERHWACGGRTLQTEEAGRDSPTSSRTRQDSQLLFVPLETPPRSFNPRNGWGMITLKRKDWQKQDYGGF